MPHLAAALLQSWPDGQRVGSRIACYPACSDNVAPWHTNDATRRRPSAVSSSRSATPRGHDAANGSVGAGPWAKVFHAPMLAAGPATTLAAVWARRAEAARAFVAGHGGVVAASFNELIDAYDAVAFAVPPDVQAELAPHAATSGNHLLLEKPLAFSLPDAERIVEAVDNAGVQSVLMLRNRFTEAGRTFVDTVTASSRCCGDFMTAAQASGVYATC